jgi:hypothetical protein
MTESTGIGLRLVVERLEEALITFPNINRVQSHSMQSPSTSEPVGCGTPSRRGCNLKPHPQLSRGGTQHAHVGATKALIRRKLPVGLVVLLILVGFPVGCGQSSARMEAPVPGAGTGGGAAGASGGASGSVAGGGAGGGGFTERQICDGSADLRFAVGTPLYEHLSAPVAVGVIFELGTLYLLINGRCEYVTWTSDAGITATGIWGAARKGVLSETTARELADAFSYSRWPELEGVYGPLQGEPFALGARVLFLFDGRHRVVCQTPCRTSAPDIQRAEDGLNAWIARLYEQGEDVNGRMRMRVFEMAASRATSAVAQPWPLSRPASEFLTPTTDPLCGPSPDCPTSVYGPAYVLDAPEDVAILSKLRADLAGREDWHEAAIATHEDPSKNYWYAFRDVISFENEEATIPGLFGDSTVQTEGR